MRTTTKFITRKYSQGTQIFFKDFVKLAKKNITPSAISINEKTKRTNFINGNFPAILNTMQYFDEVKPLVPTQPIPSIQPPVEPVEPQPPIPIQPPSPAPQIIPEPAEPSVPPIVPLPTVPPAPGPPIVPEVPFVPTAVGQFVA